MARLSPRRAAAFERRLRRLLKDLDVDDGGPDARTFSMVLGFYPVAGAGPDPDEPSAEPQP